MRMATAMMAAADQKVLDVTSDASFETAKIVELAMMMANEVGAYLWRKDMLDFWTRSRNSPAGRLIVRVGWGA